jgi:hypothetical protein
MFASAAAGDPPGGSGSPQALFNNSPRTVINSLGIVLSAGVFTLPAGTYQCLFTDWSNNWSSDFLFSNGFSGPGQTTDAFYSGVFLHDTVTLGTTLSATVTPHPFATSNILYCLQFTLSS